MNPTARTWPESFELCVPIYAVGNIAAIRALSWLKTYGQFTQQAVKAHKRTSFQGCACELMDRR